MSAVSPAVLTDRVWAPPTDRSRAITRDAVLVLGFALLTAGLAQVELRLSFTPVPITGQTLGVLLAGGALGSKRGGLSQLLYWGMGLIGLPFYSGGDAGWASGTGSTLGYFVGFIVAAFVVGRLAERQQDRPLTTSLSAMALASVIIYVFGATWLAHDLGIPIATGEANAIGYGVTPFLIGDLIKLAWPAHCCPRPGPSPTARTDTTSVRGPGSEVEVERFGADGTDRLEVAEVGIDDVDDVDVVDDLDARIVGLAQQVRGQIVLADHDQVVDVLTSIDHVGRLQALGMQPAHVERQQLLELVGRQACLCLGRQVLGHELQHLVDQVHHGRAASVPMRLLRPTTIAASRLPRIAAADEDPRDRFHVGNLLPLTCGPLAIREFDRAVDARCVGQFDVSRQQGVVSVISARATYVASYALRLCRSAHILVEGRIGREPGQGQEQESVQGRRALPLSEAWTTRRRRTLVTSLSMRCGTASSSSPRRSGSRSFATSSTIAPASTTLNRRVRRAKRRGSWLDQHGREPWPGSV